MRTQWVTRNKQLLQRRGIAVNTSQLEVCYDNLKACTHSDQNMPKYIDRQLVSSQLWERLFAEKNAMDANVKVKWDEEIVRLEVLNHQAGKWTPQLDKFASLTCVEKMALYQSLIGDSGNFKLAPPDGVLVAKFLNNESVIWDNEAWRLHNLERAGTMSPAASSS